MQLIADRFVADDRGCAIDLATGDRVSLVVSTAGGPGEQAAWAERCAWLSMVVHPSIAPLVDYGVIGETQRFEAWAAEPGWSGSRAAAEHAASCASQFLAGCGRAPAGSGDLALGARDGRAVILPGASVGLPAAGGTLDQAAGAISRDVLGVIRGAERRLGPVVDLLTSPTTSGLSALAIWSPDAGDARGAVLTVARAARLGGLVPVDVRRLDGPTRSVLSGRTLVCLARHDVGDGWRALLDAVTTCARPHLVCFIGAFAVRRVHTVSLERISADALVASVGPPGLASRFVKHITTAARRSQGLRGRFEQLLFGGSRMSRPADRSPDPCGETTRAAEEFALPESVRDQPPTLAGVARVWPAPGEVVRLRRQAEAARAHLRAGRFQPGERLARQVMHACARRGEWTSAVDVALLLARSLLRRGRVDGAATVARNMRPWAASSRDLLQLRAAALLQADVLIEQARLADAELILEPLLAAAFSSGDEDGGEVALSMARCLHWQGRYAEAWQRLALTQVDERTSIQTRMDIVRSSVAIGREQIGVAVACASRARESALAGDDPTLKAEAIEASAWAQLAAGDDEQAEEMTTRALAHARCAHEPMLLLRLRLLRAEASRRRGHRTAAVTLVRRCGRLTPASLPPLLRARLDVLRELLSDGGTQDSAERRADMLGLPALKLFVPLRSRLDERSTSTTDDIVALLQCCQVAQEDRSVLAAMCARLRSRLDASAVAFFLSEGAQPVLVSSEGTRMDVATVARALCANQLVLPTQGIERAEAAVPVRYAGQVIGALAASWAPGARWHAADIRVLLSTGATAAGPALSGLRSARSAERAVRASELLGVSGAAAEIRAAIERAAPAPFAVLVEGESGSGKELVARLLHKLGPRRDRPFCSLNCAALPDDLVESELFGHARGAFTGAAAERRGVFEDAHTGTLFLDEVGELSPRAQAKLLRAIQEGEIRRVGENSSRRVDVRLVAATNRDLRAEAAAGRFRLDLLFRLDVIRITVPPLRERRADIPVLIDHIWRDATTRVSSRAVLAPATVDTLARHDWPGNVRELQNVLAALVVRCPRRGVIPPSALPASFCDQGPTPSLRLDQARETFDRAFIRAALVRNGGQRSRAARDLGLSRQGLAKLMARLALAADVASESDISPARGR